MPSPIGHALAGIAVALAGDRRPVAHGVWRVLSRPLTLCCVALAALPDADLLLPGLHRRATHSVGATILVTIVAIVVTEWVTRLTARGRAQAANQTGAATPAMAANPAEAENHAKTADPDQAKNPAWRVVVVLAAAHASHLLMDWLGTDLSTPAGIQVLWPFSDRWFISGWDLFPQLERRDMFSLASIAINLRAIVWEVVLLGPIVSLLWWLRARPRSAQPPSRRRRFRRRATRSRLR